MFRSLRISHVEFRFPGSEKLGSSRNGRMERNFPVIPIFRNFRPTSRGIPKISERNSGKCLFHSLLNPEFPEFLVEWKAPAVLCAVKSDKRKFKDKPFINRWSASQIKHITAKSNSSLRQKILFDIDYQSFAVVGSLFVSNCRRSRWRFFCNEYLASTLSSHF